MRACSIWVGARRRLHVRLLQPDERGIAESRRRVAGSRRGSGGRGVPAGGVAGGRPMTLSSGWSTGDEATALWGSHATGQQAVDQPVAARAEALRGRGAPAAARQPDSPGRRTGRWSTRRRSRSSSQSPPTRATPERLQIATIIPGRPQAARHARARVVTLELRALLDRVMTTYDRRPWCWRSAAATWIPTRS